MAKVLSLFDGMACGMIAMQLAGVEVESYDAYEIDKYAIKTAQHNFPMIKEHGDVFDADFTQYDGVDFLIGGSPCTYWSIAQTKNRETVASGMGWELFSQYVRSLREAKPKYFIYENNKSMSKEIRASIDEAFGFEAVCINSALVSAQNRQRLYWVGKRTYDGTYSKVDVEQPRDRGILLKDVLDGAVREKAHAVITSAGRTTEREFFKKNQGNMVAEPCCMRYERNVSAVGLNVNPSGKGMNGDVIGINWKSRNLTTNKGEGQKVIIPVCVAERGRMYRNEPQHYEARPDGKTNTLTSVEKDNRVAEPVGTTQNEKSFALTAYYSTGQNAPHTLEKHLGSMVAEPVQIGRMPREDGIVTDSKQYRVYDVDGKAVTQCGQGGGLGAKTGLYAVPVEPKRICNIDGGGQGNRIYSTDAKSCAIKANGGGLGGNGQGLYALDIPSYSVPCEWDENGEQTKAVSCSDGKVYPVYKVENGEITIKDKQYPIKLVDGYYIIRKLTVSECKRLQTVPEWYDFSCVSNSQAYKMLGNGWTCEVIAHLIRSTIVGTA